MTTLTTQLMIITDAFAGATRRSRARVSTLIFNDGKRLDRIAAGSDIGTRAFEAAMRWLSDHWPPDESWPAHIPRPAAPEADCAGPAPDPIPSAVPAQLSGDAP